MGEVENLWGRCLYFLGNLVLFFIEQACQRLKGQGMCVVFVEDKIIFYGGFGGKNYVYGDIFYLKFKV